MPLGCQGKAALQNSRKNDEEHGKVRGGKVKEGNLQWKRARSAQVTYTDTFR
jgi:hypothetical protein